jgi:hypothetical protein
MTQFQHRSIPRRPCCGICGCESVRLDYFDGEVPLELGECPRCSHRWTRSMLAPQLTRARVGSHSVAAQLLRDSRGLPQAA